MADYRVRFVGDLGNLGQFNNTIRGALAANSRILNQASSNVVSRSIGAPVVPAGSNQAGFTLRNAVTEIDKFNNAIIQSGQVVRRYIQDYETQLNQLTGRYESAPLFGEAFHSDFRKAIANADQYAQVVAKLAPVEQRIQSIQKSGADRIAQIQNAGIAINSLRDIPRNQRFGPEYDRVYQQAFSDLRSAYGNFKLPTFQLQNINLDPSTGRVLTPADVKDYEFRDQPYITDKALINVGNADIKTWQDLKRAIILSGKSFDATFASLAKGLSGLQDTTKLVTDAQINAIRNSPLVRSIEADALFAASNPGGYISAQSANVLAQYPDIRRDLVRKAGLGLQQPYQVGGALNQNFFQAAEQQQFNVSSISRDMERNLTHIRGSLIDTNGVLTDFTYTLDANGNAINSWGRKLSGTRGILTETSRNLIKVIEWTVATTVVFGALGTAISSVSSINELNLNLQRFAITARLTDTELQQMFKGLASVAFSTATPINELVKAADDMALATRRANQSGEEWRQSILELANAVGILTNISGLDTVRATDLLVASMKQLNLETNQLVPLLSQITAAGGGQANAITDIATGLAGLAEAAEQAQIPLTGQIAAIQVISQITGKSADQTANAFKNLFGAINADSSVKKLEEFGIAVRDVQTGELRPFLTIYKEISDAIESGIIPQGRVNEILRAISGGRTGRQADAAALLANINKVLEVQGVVANASNEALIANAKILDTNQARIVRFQNSFNISVYEKFNGVIKDMTGALADVGTILAQVFGLFPGPFVAAATEVLLLATAFTVLGKAANAIGLATIFNNLVGRGSKAGATGALKFVPEIGTSSRLPGTGLLSLLPLAVRESILNKALSGEAPLVAERTLKEIYASKTARANFPTIDDTDLRSLVGLRATSSRVSPFTPQYDPIRDLPLIGVPSQPYVKLPYDVPTINYVGTGRELTRQDVPSLAKDIPYTSYIPGAVIKDADEVGRRIGVAAGEGVSKGIRSSLSRLARGRAGIAAVGAAGAAGASAIGGPDIASIGQLIGGSLLFTPAAPLGAGILAASTAMSIFQGEQNRVKENTKELRNELYDLTQQWKQDQASVTAAQGSYDRITQNLKSAQEGTQQYIDLQGQLGEATVKLALALDTQAGSTASIIEKVKELSALGGSKALSQFASGLVGQSLNQDQVTELVGLVSEQILAASGQPVFRPTNTNFDPNNLNFGPVSNARIRVFDFNTLIPNYQDVSPEQFATNQENFKDFLRQRGYDQTIFGGTGRANFDTADAFPFQNPAAVSAFLTAADTLRDSLPDDQQRIFIDNVITPFQNAVAQFANATTQINQALTNARTEIEARQLLGLLSGDQAAIATSNINSAERLQGYLTSPTASIYRFDPEREREINPFGVRSEDASRTISQLTANALTGTFDPALFKTAADQSLQALGVFDELPEGIERTTAQATILREEFGLTDEAIIKILGSMGNLKTTASEALDAAIEKTKTWRDGQLQSIGDRLVDLQARLQGGEFKRTKENPNGPEQYQALLAQLTALQDAIQNTTPDIDNLTEAAFNFTNMLGAEGAATAATNLIGSLNALQINGFQGVEGSIDAANNALFGLMTRLNLSGPQIAQVVAKWVQVLALAAKAAVIAQQIASLPNLTGSNYTGGPASLANFSAQTQAQRQMDALLADIKKILGSGTGTAPLVPKINTSTSGPKATVDTLYLSEEQQKVADPLALVKQAYQDALRLQSQIPGEEKRNRLNTVIVFDELQSIFKARGVSEELLRRALDNLTEQMEIANQKADTIRRIRVGAGDFSAIANVPVNLQSGVSVGANNQINITFNLNGTNLTPAQFTTFANMIGAEIARRL